MQKDNANASDDLTEVNDNNVEENEITETNKTEQSSENQDNKLNNEIETIRDLEAQNVELKDKYIRLVAEFENYKKRTIREKLDLLKTASQDTLTALLPVLDDFDRAKNSGEAFSEGVTLVYNKLENTLRNMGLQPMNSTGENFDPEKHEAVTEIALGDESMKGKVFDTVERGYLLHDKIIRFAKVVIAK
ncbi:MAG: nucleotide exchange factor GrpE [Saprospiraceae bacterium]|nr:nucleotide exchange factor GrpE [Saprospiraceae bacterium]